MGRIGSFYLQLWYQVLLLKIEEEWLGSVFLFKTRWAPHFSFIGFKRIRFKNIFQWV